MGKGLSMQPRSTIDYYDEGLDLLASSLYQKAAEPFGAARILHPVAFRSLAFSELEDATVWTRDWICVGSHDLIPDNGDLLPYTVGTHGLHAQRTPSGFAARFNKAQHGGCRTVPLQCQTGTKTRCSFTSCGYSRDRDVIKSGSLEEESPEMHQYLGLRPERLLTAKLANWMQFILINLDPASEDPDASLRDLGGVLNLDATAPLPLRSHKWAEFDANWKLLGQNLTAGNVVDEDADGSWIATRSSRVDGSSCMRAWVFPNLVLCVERREVCAVVLQPTAMGRTLCRVSVFSEADVPQRSWMTDVCERAAAAVKQHADLTCWYTASAPSTHGNDMPLQDDAVGAWMQHTLIRRIRRELGERPVQREASGGIYAGNPA